MLLSACVFAHEQKREATISGFNANYLLLGNDSIRTNTNGGLDCDIKFQLSFSRRLRPPITLRDTPYISAIEKLPLFFGYTQESYWDICGDSAPFRETNYRPTLFYRKVYENTDQELYFGYEHESNGRDGEESKSWDRLIVRYRTPLTDSQSNTNLSTFDRYVWTADVALWYPFNIGGNTQNIQDFAGYGELSVTYTPNQDYRFRMTARKGGGFTDWDRGLVEVDILFPIPRFEIKGFIQYVNGYGASLERFDQQEQSLRIGVMFSDYNPFRER